MTELALWIGAPQLSEFSKDTTSEGRQGSHALKWPLFYFDIYQGDTYVHVHNLWPSCLIQYR